MAYLNRNIPDEISAESPKGLKRLFLVDFENVHDDGLIGIDGLLPDDHVVIFFGPQIKSISFDSHIAVMQSRAQIENMQTTKSAKNYLDFQLSTYLGFLVGRHRYESIVIISKDTGFDSVVDFWSRNEVPAARRPQISVEAPEDASKKGRGSRKKTKSSNSAAAKPSANSKRKPPKAVDPPESTRKRLRAAFADLHLPSSNYSIIYKAFSNSADKLALNNALQKSFGSRGTEIYHAAKNIFVEYKDSKAPSGGDAQ